jgi:DNA polymerase-3 subunit delta'
MTNLINTATFPETVTEGLKTALEENRFPHALLIYGSNGLGKKGLALSIAASLLCEKKNYMKACDCSPCTRIWGEGHPDVKLFPEEGGSTIKVDHIRELIGWARFKPFEANRKVLILDEVENLSDEALNAFLKLLEEPPANTTLLLLATQPSRLRKTFLSRCFQVPLRPLPATRLKDALLNQGLNDAEAHFVSLSSEGFAEAANEMVEAEVFKSIDSKLTKLLSSYSYEIVEDVLAGKSSAKAADKRGEVKGYLDAAQKFLRDVSLWMSLEGESKGQIFFEHRIDWIKKQALQETCDTLYSKQNQLEVLRRNLERYANPRITLMRISEIMGEPIIG